MEVAVTRWETCSTDGKFLRKLEVVRERWKNFIASLLNATSAALDQTIIEDLSPKPAALSPGDPRVVNETKQVLRYMANRRAMGPNELQAELLTLGLYDSSYEILLALHDIKVIYKKKDLTECGKYSVLFLVAVDARFSLKSWPIDLATSARKLGSFPRNSSASGPNARQKM